MRDKDNVIEVIYYLYVLIKLRREPRKNHLSLFLNLQSEGNSTYRVPFVFKPQQTFTQERILLKLSDPAMREEYKLAITEEILVDNDFQPHVLEGFVFR